MNAYNSGAAMRRFCVLFLGLWLLASDAGACTRDDVDFYLNKGFSKDQIAALCGGETRSPNEYRNLGDAEEEAYRRGLQRRHREDDDRFVQTALDAHGVVLTPKYLQYTHGLCMRVINQPDVEARDKICPDVRFRVYLRGLEVDGYDRKFFIAGDRAIKVRGRVSRKLVEDLRKYAPPLRNAIRRAFKSDLNEHGTAIPVRSDAAIERVIGLLRERIAEANTRSAQRRRAERRARQ